MVSMAMVSMAMVNSRLKYLVIFCFGVFIDLWSLWFFIGNSEMHQLHFPLIFLLVVLFSVPSRGKYMYKVILGMCIN